MSFCAIFLGIEEKLLEISDYGCLAKSIILKRTRLNYFNNRHFKKHKTGMSLIYFSREEIHSELNKG